MFKTREELQKSRAAYVAALNAEKKKILVCAGTGCVSGGALKVFDKLLELLKANNVKCELELSEENDGSAIGMKKSGCHGFCEMGPLVRIEPQGWLYTKVKVEDCEEIVEKTILKGEHIERLAFHELKSGIVHKEQDDIPFYKMQDRIVLKHCGLIDATSIKEYIAVGGYEALEKCIFDMTPEGVIQEVLDSGLRGRGGAGFPTGRKWDLARRLVPDADQKYVCCNGDEGDPGAFMDRSIMEGDPHCVIEAMAITGYAIGASKGFIYVRAEYPIAVQRLQLAIDKANEMGLLGKNILGSGFDFELEIRLGAGAFVCGEETALMTSIEGNRGEPRPRPPFPAVKGLFGKPTVENNVETFANIPHIIRNGAAWFASTGTEKSKGTKVFALGGKIGHTGLVEVPMGTTLRTIIEDIGGGIPGGKKFKAAQTGGPSGGCIPDSLVDTPIDYDNLTSIGCMMGSGGLIVMDEDNCMVDIARFFLDFTVDESCGKCTPCRVGIKRLYEKLDKIINGQGELKDLDEMEELCTYIKQNALCGLGQTAPNPVLATLRFFRDEYVAHVVDKKCPAHVCKSLMQYKIIDDKCKGCTACARKCPVGAIQGKVKELHTIDQAKCIKCGACIDTCKFSAIVKE